jgi:hypothetical protein
LPSRAAITLNQYDIFLPYFFSIAGKCASRLGSLVAIPKVYRLSDNRIEFTDEEINGTT